MKKFKFTRRIAPLAVVALLLPAALMRAQPVSFTATGWVNAVLAPGILATNALGQVLLHSNVHTARVQSPAPRVAGQVFIIGDGSFNADGTQPELDVTYDHLELRTSEIPPVVIERAVRLSWPASATINYAGEGAPTLQGPWLPVQDLAILGLNQMTVPPNSPAQFFRLVQAP